MVETAPKPNRAEDNLANPRAFPLSERGRSGIPGDIQTAPTINLLEECEGSGTCGGDSSMGQSNIPLRGELGTATSLEAIRPDR